LYGKYASEIWRSVGFFYVAVKPHILFVCGRNKRRSPTAVNVYRNDQRFTVYSAGISGTSGHQINQKDIHWADVIFVFEDEYGKWIKRKFNESHPKIINLSIPDEFEYMDSELIELIKTTTENYLDNLFN